MQATRASSVFVGVDFGTSGCRLCAIDTQGLILAEHSASVPASCREHGWSTQVPQHWWQVFIEALAALVSELRDPITAIAVDGTSASLLLSDAQGQPLTPALMYDDARAQAQGERLHHIAPAQSAAHGPSSSLAKLMWLTQHTDTTSAAYALHQADWINGRLLGHYGLSDENNALKLGYDPITRQWPDWLSHTGVDTTLLPRIYQPGQVLGVIDAKLAHRYTLPADMKIVAGTTDSVAAFLATGATDCAEAVTSLGSTLVLKILCDKPIFAPQWGVYSHRLSDQWLVGGASNSGGAVLLQHFCETQLERMTPQLRPDVPTGLDYYPLPAIGERFPFADPNRVPRLQPRPSDDVQFFQALLEGIAAIEAQGYARLQALGAPQPQVIYSVGGGAGNRAWTQIRQRVLNIALREPAHHQACYGAALLARRGIMPAH